MQKANRTYRFIALLMALLMFITSVGFTVDLHYCSGEFKSFSLLGKARSCHEQSASGCPHHRKMMEESQSDQIDTNTCCNNKMVHIQSDQDKVIQNISAPETLDLDHFIHTLIPVFFPQKTTEEDRIPYTRYKPPIIPRDIPVLIQSFLL